MEIVTTTGIYLLREGNDEERENLEMPGMDDGIQLCVNVFVYRGRRTPASTLGRMDHGTSSFFTRREYPDRGASS
jgi:hypothetical protein